jgi:hypothetical protein
MKTKLYFLMPVLLLGLVIAGSWSVVEAQPKLDPKAANWEYAGNAQCKMCHNNAAEGAQFSTWEAMDHAKAFETLKSDEAKAIAQERGLDKPPHEAPECLRCHVTGYDVAKAAPPAKIKLEDGLQCESCHGPASEHLGVAKTLKFKPEKISEIDIRASILHPSEEVCRGCHNPESPTWDPERYTKEDGTKDGFDFAESYKKIAHDYPEGHLEKKYGGAYPQD